MEFTFDTPPNWTIVLAMGKTQDIPRLQDLYPKTYLIDTYAWRRAFYPSNETGELEARRWILKQTLSLLRDLCHTHQTVVLLGEFPSRAERALYLQQANQLGIHTELIYFCGADHMSSNKREIAWYQQYCQEFEFPSPNEGFQQFQLIYT